MENDSIFVTVLMPVYNGQIYLQEAIDSILNQTFSNFELIILNDGSTDDSEKIIQSYTDKRIVYINNNKNLGLIETLNKGIGLASGKYIARMDADDISFNNRFEKQVNFLEENLEFGLLGSSYLIFGDKEEEVYYPTTHDKLKITCLLYNPFCHPSVMIRKSVLDDFNLKFQKKYVHAEEYKLWTEIMSLTKCHNLNEILLKYRSHSNQVSQVHLKKQLEITKIIQVEYLKNAGFNLSENNLKIIEYLSNKMVPLSNQSVIDIIEGIDEIIKQNRILLFFDVKLLNQLLYNYYKNILLDMQNVDKTLYKIYKNSLLLEDISWTKRQKISILVKFIRSNIFNYSEF